MSPSATGFDPLIAEAKFRMRRRRVLLAVLVLLAGAGAVTLAFRPSGLPGTTRVTGHGGSQSALAHLNVPVDKLEREWRAGIRSLHSGCACGITRKGVIELRHNVVAVARATGATVVRMRVWQPSGEVEVVLATRTDPAQYLVHQATRVVRVLDHGYPYVRIVNGSGSRFYEWYRLPGRGGVWMPRPLTLCGPIIVSAPVSTPSCPVK